MEKLKSLQDKCEQQDTHIQQLMTQTVPADAVDVIGGQEITPDMTKSQDDKITQLEQQIADLSDELEGVSHYPGFLPTTYYMLD